MRHATVRPHFCGWPAHIWRFDAFFPTTVNTRLDSGLSFKITSHTFLLSSWSNNKSQGIVCDLSTLQYIGRWPQEYKFQLWLLHEINSKSRSRQPSDKPWRKNESLIGCPALWTEREEQQQLMSKFQCGKRSTELKEETGPSLTAFNSSTSWWTDYLCRAMLTGTWGVLGGSKLALLCMELLYTKHMQSSSGCVGVPPSPLAWSFRISPGRDHQTCEG